MCREEALIRTQEALNKKGKALNMQYLALISH